MWLAEPHIREHSRRPEAVVPAAGTAAGESRVALIPRLLPGSVLSPEALWVVPPLPAQTLVAPAVRQVLPACLLSSGPSAWTVVLLGGGEGPLALPWAPLFSLFAPLSPGLWLLSASDCGHRSCLFGLLLCPLWPFVCLPLGSWCLVLPHV